MIQTSTRVNGIRETDAGTKLACSLAAGKERESQGERRATLEERDGELLSRARMEEEEE